MTDIGSIVQLSGAGRDCSASSVANEHPQVPLPPAPVGPSLYTLSAEFGHLLELEEEAKAINDEEALAAIRAEIEAFQMPLAKKCEQRLMRSMNRLKEAEDLEAQAAVWRKHADGDDEKALMIRKDVGRDNEETRRQLETIGLLKPGKGGDYKAGQFRVSLRIQPESVVIDDANKIPGDFLKYSDPVIDKKKLCEALKQGEIPGARLVRNEPKLVIK